MALLAATLAATMPLVLAGEGTALSPLPVAGYPEIIIRKGEHAHEWPFSVDVGELTCVKFADRRNVIFSEILTPEEMGEFGNMTLPRNVVVSANPFGILASHDDRTLYAPFDSLETLIVRLAPYEKMGWKLCDQAGDTPDEL